MNKSLKITKCVMMISWVVTVICILLYVGIGTYASLGLGYNTTDALGFAPEWIRGCVTFACTSGFIGIFAGMPISIVLTFIYISSKVKKTDNER